MICDSLFHAQIMLKTTFSCRHLLWSSSKLNSVDYKIFILVWDGVKRWLKCLEPYIFFIAWRLLRLFNIDHFLVNVFDSRSRMNLQYIFVKENSKLLKISLTPIGVSLTGLLFYLFGLNEMFITYCKTRGDIFIPWYISYVIILENLVLTSLMLLIDYNFWDFFHLQIKRFITV